MKNKENAMKFYKLPKNKKIRIMILPPYKKSRKYVKCTVHNTKRKLLKGKTNEN